MKSRAEQLDEMSKTVAGRGSPPDRGFVRGFFSKPLSLSAKDLPQRVDPPLHFFPCRAKLKHL